MRTRDLRLLSYFVQIAETGSVRGAADRLHVSPPVVSKALADLEDGLGVTLVKRGRRGVSLTVHGEKILGHALAMVRSGERAFEAASDPDSVTGPLAITLSTELCASWFPAVMRAFERRCPNVLLQLSAFDVTLALHGSEFDVALRAYRVEQPREDDIVLPLTVVCAPSLLGSRRASLEHKLRHLPFIGFAQRPGSSIPAYDRRTGERSDVEVRTRFVVDNGLVATELARQGMGAALVMEATAARGLADGSLVPVSRRHRFGAAALRVELRDRLPTPAARAFVEHLAEYRGRKITS